MPKHLRKIGKVWYSDVRIAGKRVRKPLDPDERVAKEKLKRLLERARDAKYGSLDPPWALFRAKYLEWSAGAKARNTARLDKMAVEALERYRVPRKLSEVSAVLLDQYKAFRRASGKAPATINRELGALKAMLRKGMAWGDVPRAELKISRLKEPKGRLLFYTPAQCHALLSRLEGPYLTAALLALRAGLRRAEILHTAWADVDLARGVLAVSPKEGWVPKDHDTRYIPIPPDLAEHLAALPRTGEWVLHPRPSAQALTVVFREAVAEAELQGSLHTLRHTYASHLVQAGVPLLVVSKLLGHASAKTTEVYAHLAPSAMVDAVAKLPVVWSKSGHSPEGA